jgi:hypothetical protein
VIASLLAKPDYTESVSFGKLAFFLMRFSSDSAFGQFALTVNQNGIA